MLPKAALRSILFISLLGLLITSQASTVSAGSNVWTSIGPEGGYITSLAIDPATPTTLYVGTFGGVFKSTNGGGNWNAFNTGLTTTVVYALAIDPATPITLYVGTFGGVFKSTNGGGNWSAVNTGLMTNTFVSTLAIDPATPTTLYAGTYYGGVFKSTDGGGNWSAINAGLTNIAVQALAIDPKTPSTLYAGTNGGGVFVLQQNPTLQVNTTNDFVDPIPGDGVCGVGGSCSLRAAIMEANARSGQDSISIPAGDYALTLGGLTISDTVQLNGAGQDQTIIRGSAAITTSPVVLLTVSANLANLTIRDGAGGGVAVDNSMHGAADVIFDHVTVFNNTSNGAGGGIILWAIGNNMTLNHSRVISNTAAGGGYGGGINVGDYSAVILNDSVVAGNTAAGSGGGIHSEGGRVDVNGSTIADNTAVEDGGGVSVRIGGEDGVLRLVNSTVSGNSARYGGGLISQLYGQIEITNTTIANNSASVAGGGLATTPVTFTQSITQVHVESAAVISLINTLVADNLAPTGADCYHDTGQLSSKGHNLIGTTTGCVITSTATDLVNINALLGPLQDNGGDTPTHALLPGSPAINAGDNAACPATDQRGVPRPIGPACDIGAYEWVKILPIYLPLIMCSYSPPIPLQANFIATPTSGVVPLTVVFTNTSTGTYTASRWNFGDGVTSTLPNPAHVYTATGVYTVALTVNNATETSTLTRTRFITVTAPPTLTVDFSATPTSGVVPLTVVFTNTSIGSYTSSLWNFGDGVTNTLKHPTHVYTRTGIYTVSLTVSKPTGSLVLPGDSNTLVRSGYITVTAVPPALIINGGFETNAAWEFGNTPVPGGYVTNVVHTGLRGVRVGIEPPMPDQYTYSSVYQRITLPVTANRMTLSFWYWPRREGYLAAERPLVIPRATVGQSLAAWESTLTQDLQYVMLLDSNMQVIGTLINVIENDSGWRYATFDLPSYYAGVTLYVYFGVFNDGNFHDTRAWMNVDDVSLTVAPGASQIALPHDYPR